MLRPILYGGLAGIAATVAMTAAMRRLHRSDSDGGRDRDGGRDDYPLPPRELLQRMTEERRTGDAGTMDDGASPLPSLREATVAAHFGFGALTGALFALVTRKRSVACGMGYGVFVWAASYLGWIPAARLLAPATRHPPGRNALMVAAHLVWGAVLARGLREIEASAEEDFSAGPALDAPDSGNSAIVRS